MNSNIDLRTLKLDGFMLQSDAPSTGEEWKSISEKVQFQISSDFDEKDEKMKNTLRLLLEGDQDSMPARRRMDSQSNPYSKQAMFVDGQESYYEAYSQAWRYLGYYVDCNPDMDNDRRRLEDGGSDCTRYLLWAGYVDPYYQGNGLYEYQFYDRYDDEWTSYCADEDNCRKMDCHEDDTDFKLIGFFKHEDYDDFQEQLFKHEGVCVWTDDEYEFMKDEEDLLPVGCEMIEYATDDAADGDDALYLYYALRPLPKGDVGIGLYTDSKCSQLYSDEEDHYSILENIVDMGGNSGSGDNYGLNETIALYNDAFGIFKVCQPCVAYDLENGFECDDEAGYTNVNQCMKFSSKCERKTASIADVALAAQQRSTVNFQLMGNYLINSAENSYQNEVINVNDLGVPYVGITFLMSSMAIFGYGLFTFFKVRKALASKTSFKEPLVPNGGTFA